MPEGDSIHNLARELAPALVGREVVSFSARRLPRMTAQSVVGHRVLSVVARGKNLLIGFDDERVLHIHLRMNGRLRLERPRSAFWNAPRASPEVQLVVDGASVVGRDIPILRLLTSTQVRRDPALSGLGPDLTTVDWDEEQALTRLRGLGDRPISSALLVQHAMAGIGNVYKSEVLFLEGIDPRAVVSSLCDDELRALLRRASALLRSNLGKGPRTTRRERSGPRLWVYRRAGRPCLRCGTPVERFLDAATAERGRSTYYCPKCQHSRP
jgi:endonuclease-8